MSAPRVFAAFCCSLVLWLGGCGFDRTGLVEPTLDTDDGAAGAFGGGPTGGAGGSAAGGASDGGAGDGAAGTGGIGVLPDAGVDAMPPLVAGCADGTREGFVNLSTHPRIAACVGGWSVPGLTTRASQAPACGRMAGNHSSNPGGTGCSAADLCAESWHICVSAVEVDRRLSTGCEGAVLAPRKAFFATRQGATQSGTCPQNPSSNAENNLHGCGNVGSPEMASSCQPLDRLLRSTDCAMNPPWSCGSSGSGGTTTSVVTKMGGDGGGVLCCRD